MKTVLQLLQTMTQPSLYTSFDVSVFDLNPHQSFSSTDSIPSTHQVDSLPIDHVVPLLTYISSIDDEHALSKFISLYRDRWIDDCTLAVVVDDQHFESVIQVANDLSPNPEIHYLATSITDLETTSLGEPFDFIIAAVPLHQGSYTQLLRAIRPHLQLSSLVLVVDISGSGPQILDPISLVQTEGFRLVCME
jgi:hypothetical protein